MSDTYDIQISALINKVFFLSKKTHKNKDWYKKDFSKDVILFLNLTWICFMAIVFLGDFTSDWYIVLAVAILFIICLVSLLISFATWTEAKKLQSLYEMEE